MAQASRAAARAARTRRARAPRWARICAFLGAFLMFASGGVLVGGELLKMRYANAVGTDDLFEPDPAVPQRKSDIKGPLNILLVGIDPRPNQPNSLPRADAVLILHVNASLDQGYLFSLPRDLYVAHPAFPKAGMGPGMAKITDIMGQGGRSARPGGPPNAAQGFQLLAKTLTEYTGIRTFDAGAIVNFAGFEAIVNEMGGVTMPIDMTIESIHRQPDGKHRKGSGIRGAEGPDAYVGPRKKYTKGTHHLAGWEALDYVRQRYELPGNGGDYVRHRHQQQFIRAMVTQAVSKDVMTNPAKLDAVLRAGGKAVIFNGRGHSVLDFGFALRNLRADSLVMVKLHGGGVYATTKTNGKPDYLGEQLNPIAKDFFAALRAGQLDTFIPQHMELVNSAN